MDKARSTVEKKAPASMKGKIGSCRLQVEALKTMR